jgi:hypothetical protein
MRRVDFLLEITLTLYYDSRNTLWHKRPDWFLVLGAAPGRSIGQPIPTDLERANQSRQIAEQESQRADRLAARLRALGIDPNSLDD